MRWVRDFCRWLYRNEVRAEYALRKMTPEQRQALEDEWWHAIK